MWNNKICLLLCILYVGGSLAKSFQPTSFDYDYQVESRNVPRRHKIKSVMTTSRSHLRQEIDSRNAPRRNRGKSVTTTPRPLLQQYWHNFVSNLPTLPPLSWNLTNPIGNLFNAGAQQIIETPVSNHYMMEEEVMEPPVRRRRPKPSKRKSSKKVRKNRKRSQSRNYYYTSYDNSYDYEPTTQLQLQPLGLDSNRVMHFYEPTTGQYYALQQEAQPNYYNYQNGNQYQYNNYAGNSYDDGGSSIEDDDSYYNGGGGYGGESGEQYNFNGYDSDNGYDSENGYETEHDDDFGHNSYDNGAGSYGNSQEEYDDGVELVDNWGYNDEEIFADRKIKGETSNFEALAGSIIKIQKHLLKPETAEDVKLLLSKTKKPTTDKNDMTEMKKDKNEMKQETEEKKDFESVRNALGSFMKDDVINRRKQTANTKITTKLVEQPRKKEKYYIFPVNFLNKMLKR